MDRHLAIEQLKRDSHRVADLATEANLDRPVPSCPAWDLRALVGHLTSVYNRAGTIVLERRTAPPDRGSLDTRPEDMHPVDWLRDRAARVIGALEEVPEEARAWNFTVGEPAPVRFWWRRQMHESLIHRIDAELAAGVPITEVAPEIAADNISELLSLFGYSAPEAPESGAGGPPTVHIHATDVAADGAGPAEWTLDVPSRTVTNEHRKAAAAVRGPALSLARWCTGRGGEVEIIGGADVAEEWRKGVSL